MIAKARVKKSYAMASNGIVIDSLKIQQMEKHKLVGIISHNFFNLHTNTMKLSLTHWLSTHKQ